MRFNILAAIVLACLAPACTTVVRGTKQKFPITSSPSAANVRLSTTGELCITPCKLKIKRGRNLTISVSKPGFVTQEFDSAR
jgi:hypothetical protein